MSHLPLEACSNSIAVECNDEPKMPRLYEPYTSYREKNDFRQVNLPFQPFHVKGSSGELLNLEYLIASVVPRNDTDGIAEEQQGQEKAIQNFEFNESNWRRDEINGNQSNKERLENNNNDNINNFEKNLECHEVAKNKNYENLQKDKIADKNDPDNNEGGESNQEGQSKTNFLEKSERDFQDEGEEKESHAKENIGREKEIDQNPKESEAQPKHPFDHDNFFPDDACVNNYLEQNILNYQPFDCYFNKKSQNNAVVAGRVINATPIANPGSNNNATGENGNKDCQHLPRFLTIPEDDKRQSGNGANIFSAINPHSKELPAAAAQRESRQSCESQRNSFKDKLSHPKNNSNSKQIAGNDGSIKRAAGNFISEIPKSKSMTHLVFDAKSVKPFQSSNPTWTSQPNVTVDSNKKYLMPKLKPLLPKQNTIYKSVPSFFPKVTFYTEFLMSSEYKDPIDLPKDEVGFVESQILKAGQLRRTKSDANVRNKFGPLPYTFFAEKEKFGDPIEKKPLRHLNDAGIFDLKNCKRQMGNKPKGQENSSTLPILKSSEGKEKEKRIIRGKKTKKEGTRDKSRYSANSDKAIRCEKTNNVDEILKRLFDYSKDYLHYFGDVAGTLKKREKKDSSPGNGKKSSPDKNVKSGRQRNEAAETSKKSQNLETEERVKLLPQVGTLTPTSANRYTKISKGDSGTDIERRLLRERSSTAEFRKFRNYVQERNEATQKGFSGIHSAADSGTRMCSKANANRVFQDCKGTRKRDFGSQKFSSGELLLYEDVQSWKRKFWKRCGIRNTEDERKNQPSDTVIPLPWVNEQRKCIKNSENVIEGHKSELSDKKTDKREAIKTEVSAKPLTSTESDPRGLKVSGSTNREGKGQRRGKRKGSKNEGKDSKKSHVDETKKEWSEEDENCNSTKASDYRKDDEICDKKNTEKVRSNWKIDGNLKQKKIASAPRFDLAFDSQGVTKDKEKIRGSRETHVSIVANRPSFSIGNESIPAQSSKSKTSDSDRKWKASKQNAKPVEKFPKKDSETPKEDQMFKSKWKNEVSEKSKGKFEILSSNSPKGTFNFSKCEFPTKKTWKPAKTPLVAPFNITATTHESSVTEDAFDSVILEERGIRVSICFLLTFLRVSSSSSVTFLSRLFSFRYEIRFFSVVFYTKSFSSASCFLNLNSIIKRGQSSGVNFYFLFHFHANLYSWDAFEQIISFN